MAVLHFRDAYVLFNSVDLSDHVRSVTTDLSADELDDTAMGDTARSRIGGLKDSSVQIEWNQDFAASKVDATLWAAYDAGVAVPIVVNHAGSSTSATNPSLTFSVLVSNYSPVSGGVGDLGTTSATYNSVAAVVRATS